MSELPVKVLPAAGKDITAALQTGLRRLTQTYNTLSEVQQAGIADSLIYLDRGALYAWDITTLKHDEPQTFHICSADSGGISPPGVNPHYTATVNGEVYGTDAINYILYGAIMRLTYDRYSAIESQWRYEVPPGREEFDLAHTLQQVARYRWATNLLDGSGYYSALKFVKVGWTGDWSYIKGAGLKGFAPSSIMFTDKVGTLHWRVAPSLFARENNDGIIDFNQGMTYSDYTDHTKDKK